VDVSLVEIASRRFSSLAKIQLNWINDVFEYGICTIVTSRDSTLPQNGLCPEPLKCEARDNKHVCTCGKDKFRDVNNASLCGRWPLRLIDRDELLRDWSLC
jgi:hypothetical protein